MLNKKCFVLDLDGTVYLGDIPIQETVDFILRHWDTIDFHFLSNNTVSYTHLTLPTTPYV